MLEESKANDSFKDLLTQDVKFIYKKCSVTEETELDSCMTSIKAQLDGLDLVINSAGVLDERNPKRMIEINYVRNFCKALKNEIIY